MALQSTASDHAIDTIIYIKTLATINLIFKRNRTVAVCRDVAFMTGVAILPS